MQLIIIYIFKISLLKMSLRNIRLHTGLIVAQKEQFRDVVVHISKSYI